MSAIFKNELCSYPPSLFDSSFILKPQKPALVDAIWAELSSDATGTNGEVQYVLDGGTLLRRIPWPLGFPEYREICDMYCQYVVEKYGAAVFIFDGYNQSSTKDITSRTGGKTATSVPFSDHRKLSMKKGHFLSNPSNKC